MYYEGFKVRIVNGYPAIYQSEENPTVYIHILEMEKHLGRKLTNGEVVHHCDKNRENYSIDNLWCFKTIADHTAFHAGQDVKQDAEGIYYCPNKYNHCTICGEQITYGANLCKQCETIQRSKKSRCPTQDELQKILMQYNGNFTQIAKVFNVSDNAVRKWCKNYCLPFHTSDYKNASIAQ